jgi:hypothetical protein
MDYSKSQGASMPTIPPFISRFTSISLCLFATACAVTTTAPTHPFAVGQTWLVRGTPHASTQPETWSVLLDSQQRQPTFVAFITPLSRRFTGQFEGTTAPYLLATISILDQETVVATAKTTLASGADRTCFVLTLPPPTARSISGYYYTGTLDSTLFDRLFVKNPTTNRREPAAGAKLGTCILELQP